MTNVYISYAQPDSDAAIALSALLAERGVSVSLDADALVAGTDFSKEILAGIASADAILLLLSGNSTRSKCVEREFEAILESPKTVIPILLDANAKNNWIWPLVSDRRAITVRDKSDLHEIAADIHRLIEKDHVDIQLTIDGDFDRFTNDDKERVLSKISALLDIGRVRVIEKHEG